MSKDVFWVDQHTCFLPVVEDKQSGIVFEVDENGVVFSYERRVEGEYLAYSRVIGPLEDLYRAAIYALELLSEDELFRVTFEGYEGTKVEYRKLSSWFEYDEPYLVKVAEEFLDYAKEIKK